MARQWNYICTRCGLKPDPSDSKAKELLVAKTATFKSLGLHGRTIRSRTIAWLCPNCLDKDIQYNMPEGVLLLTTALDMKQV